MFNLKMKAFWLSGMFLMVVMLLSNAQALVLGEIQVNSHLGQALDARIAIVDPDNALPVEMRLAGVEAYRQLGLPYPDGFKFHFQLVNAQGAQPFIRVSSLYPIGEPFIELLIEISSPGGKLVKAFTILLDPLADLPASAVTGAQPEIVASSSQAEAIQSNVAALPGTDDSMSPIAVKPEAALLPHKTHQHRAKSVHSAPGVTSTNAPVHRMKLSMSLSISRYDPAAPMTDSNDALQEELIAKEKILEDMNVQIVAMRSVIKSLQDKLDMAGSPVGSPSVMAASEVQVSPKAEVAAPVAQLPNPPKSNLNGLKVVLPIAALLLAVAGFVWYRKYKQDHQWQHGPFDDTSNETPPVLPQGAGRKAEAPFDLPQKAEEVEQSLAELLPAETPVTRPVAEVIFPFGEQSREMPAYSEQMSEPVVPPEYMKLLEANRHLRSGNDQMAEAALLEAISISPNNPHGYLALLGIHETRKDAVVFEKIARKLKATGDVAAFNEAAAMGRKIDPDNPLYN